MKATTLGEWGPQLPIGFPSGKELQKQFRLRPFKSRIDRHLGHWKEANGARLSPGVLVASQTAKLISLIVEQAGPNSSALDESGDSTPAAELAVHRWFFSDVIYAYLFARVQSLGPMVEAPIVCDNAKCKYAGTGQFDLNTVDVRVAETTADLFRWVDLKRPFKLRDGETLLRKVKLAPVMWSTMTKPGVMSGNMSAIALTSLQDSIVAINGSDAQYTLIDSEIDEMEKIDRVIIDKRAEGVTVGVDLNTKIPCPKCGGFIVNPLDWTYESFFGTSLPLETSQS